MPQVPVADFVIPLSPNYPASQEGCPAEFQGSDNGKPICRYKQLRETLPDGVSYNVLDRGENPAADDTGVYTVPTGSDRPTASINSPSYDDSRPETRGRGVKLVVASPPR